MSTVDVQSVAELPDNLRHAACAIDYESCHQATHSGMWHDYTLRRFNLTQDQVRTLMQDNGFEFDEIDWYHDYEAVLNILSLTEEELAAYRDKLTSFASGAAGISQDELPFLPSIAYDEELKTFSSKHGTITYLDPKELIHWKNLSHLVLSNNELEYLPDLRMLSSLETIDVSHNKISSISYLPDSLLSLDINNNELTTFEGIQSLVRISISNNQLTRFVLPINMQYCDVSYNKLESIGLNSQLVTLVADHNHLMGLDISSCITLSQVIANNNKISWLRLADDSEYYGSFSVLDLEFNVLTQLPESVEVLSRMKVLLLAFNQLVSLPLGIGKLANLVSLTLNNNSLIALPESISNLSHLDTLDVSCNLLSLLPIVLSTLNIRILAAGNNRLFDVSLTGLSSLEQLYLPSNSIKVFNCDVTGPLTIVDLSENDLDVVPECFLYYNSLQLLYIKGNNIDAYPSRLEAIALM